MSENGSIVDTTPGSLGFHFLLGAQNQSQDGGYGTIPAFADGVSSSVELYISQGKEGFRFDCLTKLGPSVHKWSLQTA